MMADSILKKENVRLRIRSVLNLSEDLLYNIK